MISNHDRSGYIGASDIKYVLSNWETKTFEKWWLKKLGIDTSHFNNKFTSAGTNFEHKIIDSLEIPNIEKDKQVIKGRLRVNLDANTNDCIYEIKTYQYEKGFDLKKHKDYVNQVLTQKYISEIPNAKIVAYGLLEEDYNNYFNTIDKNRLSMFDINDNEDFYINVIPKLKYLEYCLDKGLYPRKEEYERWSSINI